MDNDVELRSEPVTALIVRQVKPDRFVEFETWANGMTPIVSKFQGYLGTDVIRPRDKMHPEYVIVARFDNYENLRAFLKSAEREEYLKESAEMTVGEMVVQETHGFASFFSLPDQPSTTAVPAKYKMAILTILALYLPLLGISTLVAIIFRGLPRPLLLLLSLCVLVPIMTWFIMPWTTWLFRRWLFPKVGIRK
jgi:antibiotic biosynthesis monooxygenase (ABM) superfamily enzyme